MASPLRSGSPKHRESSSPNRSPPQPSSAVSRRASSPSSSSPKWINPCHLPAHPIDAEKEFAGAPDLPIDELFHNVISRAKVARNHARQVKEVFLSNTFSDPDFENSMKWQREEWLPEIPAISEETFKEFSAKDAFITAYEFMQYFAVGIEQILIDRVLHEGTLTKQFTDTEFHLFQLLCEIQLGMHLQGFKPNEDVMRDVMSHEYRDIAESSRRNARDYRILRDYISATNFIARLFAYHKAKLSS